MPESHILYERYHQVNRENLHFRRIRSFIRRGRTTASQKQALAVLSESYVLKDSAVPIDFSQIFSRVAPCIVEIGFGMGHALLAQAQQNPDKNYLGIDVHEPGVGTVLAAMEKYHLTNIRLCCADAVEVFSRAMPDSSLDAVQIFFPDPWPKRRHHKRRLIQPDFIKLLHAKLTANGMLYLATDWQDYAQHMLKVMSKAEGFKNMAGENQFSPRPQERPLTKFELRGQRLGHEVSDLIFIKY